MVNSREKENKHSFCIRRRTTAVSNKWYRKERVFYSYLPDTKLHDFLQAIDYILTYAYFNLILFHSNSLETTRGIELPPPRQTIDIQLWARAAHPPKNRIFSSSVEDGGFACLGSIRSPSFNCLMVSRCAIGRPVSSECQAFPSSV